MTYKELKDLLDKMNPKQLEQKVQILPPEPDHTKPIPLHTVIAFDTVHNFFKPSRCKTRSSFDNKHHPEAFVLLMDWNLYDEDGSIGFNLLTGERIYGSK